MRKILDLIVAILMLAAIGCSNQGGAPRPYGYHRITFPEKEYQPLPDSFPYFFEYPVYGKIIKDSSVMSEPYWIDIHFPGYRGNIHLSYKPLKNNLTQYMEDARDMAYKHSVKADAIEEEVVYRENDKVYGIVYDIQGDAASSLQCFLTDRANHFLRGALYFRSRANRDSLQPVISFFKKDVQHLIETTDWQHKAGNS